mmetsp:Transcript_87464/g.247790  ORF Transcript_87464/g.247790 Transcript_87464/m.247790 type:complete len:288 (+) Transcript_87464:165-1028(+)
MGAVSKICLCPHYSLPSRALVHLVVLLLEQEHEDGVTAAAQEVGREALPEREGPFCPHNFGQRIQHARIRHLTRGGVWLHVLNARLGDVQRQAGRAVDQAAGERRTHEGWEAVTQHRRQQLLGLIVARELRHADHRPAADCGPHAAPQGGDALLRGDAPHGVEQPPVVAPLLRGEAAVGLSSNEADLHGAAHAGSDATRCHACCCLADGRHLAVAPGEDGEHHVVKPHPGRGVGALPPQREVQTRVEPCDTFAADDAPAGGGERGARLLADLHPHLGYVEGVHEHPS